MCRARNRRRSRSRSSRSPRCARRELHAPPPLPHPSRRRRSKRTTLPDADPYRPLPEQVIAPVSECWIARLLATGYSKQARSSSRLAGYCALTFLRGPGRQLGGGGGKNRQLTPRVPQGASAAPFKVLTPLPSHERRSCSRTSSWWRASTTPRSRARSRRCSSSTRRRTPSHRTPPPPEAHSTLKHNTYMADGRAAQLSTHLPLTSARRLDTQDNTWHRAAHPGTHLPLPYYYVVRAGAGRPISSRSTSRSRRSWSTRAAARRPTAPARTCGKVVSWQTPRGACGARRTCLPGEGTRGALQQCRRAVSRAGCSPDFAAPPTATHHPPRHVRARGSAHQGLVHQGCPLGRRLRRAGGDGDPLPQGGCTPLLPRWSPSDATTRAELTYFHASPWLLSPANFHAPTWLLSPATSVSTRSLARSPPYLLPPSQPGSTVARQILAAAENDYKRRAAAGQRSAADTAIERGIFSLVALFVTEPVC